MSDPGKQYVFNWRDCRACGFVVPLSRLSRVEGSDPATYVCTDVGQCERNKRIKIEDQIAADRSQSRQLTAAPEIGIKNPTAAARQPAKGGKKPRRSK